MIELTKWDAVFQFSKNGGGQHHAYIDKMIIPENDLGITKMRRLRRWANDVLGL